MNKQVIDIDVRIKPTLEKMDKIVSDLKNNLTNGTASIDFTKGVGNNISKLFDRFSEEYKKFGNLTKDGLDISNTKEMVKSGEKIIATFKELQRIVGNFDSLTVFDAKKLFPSVFNKEVDNARNSLQGVLNLYQKLDSKQLDLGQAEQKLSKLKTQIDNLQSQVKSTETLEINTKKANDKLEETKENVEKLKASLASVYSDQLNEVNNQLKAKEKKQAEAFNKINKNAPQNQRNYISKIGQVGGYTTYKSRTLKQWEKSNESSQAKTAAIKAITDYETNKKQVDKLNAEIEPLQKKAAALQNILDSLKTENVEKIGKAINAAGANDETAKKITELAQAYEERSKAADEVAKSEKELQQVQKENKGVEKQQAAVQQEYDKTSEKVQVLKNDITELTSKIDFSKIQKAFSEIGIDIKESSLKSSEGIDYLNNILNQLDAESLEKVKTALKNIEIRSEGAKDTVEEVGDAILKTADSANELNRAAQDVERLKNSILDFFSIGNTIQLFKRAVNSAMDTVKELDASMTEIAVVSDFSVGDMWEQLPEFTKEANELGVAIKDTYDATTLYIQQGLDLQHSVELSTETLKMARIAGLDAAEATNSMTSALHGFNMELNGTSAQRVSDVYSELAAISASDVQEISTAMTKTASIAHSVNMEFENTAAFLAQGIETTRESAETIGTMLKTVIARFSEVKSLYSKGEILGTDENGDQIDVNKVQKALRSAGIDMTQFLTGAEGLDQVFLRLAKNWNNLDIVQQRYISTMAAGSRRTKRRCPLQSAA